MRLRSATLFSVFVVVTAAMCGLALLFGGPASTRPGEPVAHAQQATPTPTAAATTNPNCGLSVSKSASPDTVPGGGQITYTITIDNNGSGSGDCTDLTITDVIPDDTDCTDATIVDSSSDISPDDFDINGCDTSGTVTWDTTTNLDTDGTVVAQMVVDLTSGASDGDTIHNQACATSSDDQAGECDDVSVDVAGLGSISGTVTTIGTVVLPAQPIQGATVRACGDSTLCTSATTGPDGTYVISDLQSDTSYTVDAVAPGYERLSYDEDVWVDPDTTTSGIDFALGTAGWISGTITDADGHAIEGADVGIWWGSVSQSNATATTDADGNYQLLGVPQGTYDVDASATGFASELYKNGPTDSWGATPVQVIDGQETPGIDISLDPEATISGTVIRASDGQPVEGADVCTYGSSIYTPCASSEADGNYVLHGLSADRYKLNVHAEGYVDEYYDGVMDVGAATYISVASGQNITDINFELRTGGTISGKVTDSHSNALENVDVEACLQGFSTFCQSASTDVNGLYQIEGLAGGSYTVHASSSENYVEQWYNNESSQESGDLVPVTEGSDTPHINFALHTGGTISGHVTNEDGDPVPDVDVWSWVNRTDTYYKLGTSGDDGSYTIAGLAAGSYTFIAQPYDTYADQWYNNKLSQGDADLVAVAEGQDVSSIDFVLGPGGSISGTVTDDHGAPIQDAEVTACPAAEGFYCGSATSAADGTYTITGLSYYDYTVYADATGYATQYWQNSPSYSGATPIPVSEQNPDTVGIDFSLGVEGTISGTVTAGGEPVQQALVQAYDPADASHTGVSVWTDSDGAYVLHGIGAGSYLVTAYAGGFAAEYYNEARWEEDATPVDVVAGNDTPINFTLEPGGGISGTVTDKHGNPVAGVAVYAYPQDHNEPGWWELMQLLFGSFVSTTESDGTYHIPDLGTGAYAVKASAHGYADQYFDGAADKAHASAVTVTEGQTTGSINFVFGSSCAFDVDDDGNIDIRDVQLVFAHWPSPPRVMDARYDVDGDGGIDIRDVQLVFAHWPSPPRTYCQ
ncbi:MAG: carboxypeptidase regulatory-like domain-containing protein [Dehalococcoidia bacterium]